VKGLDALIGRARAFIDRRRAFDDEFDRIMRRLPMPPEAERVRTALIVLNGEGPDCGAEAELREALEALGELGGEQWTDGGDLILRGWRVLKQFTPEAIARREAEQEHRRAIDDRRRQAEEAAQERRAAVRAERQPEAVSQAQASAEAGGIGVGAPPLPKRDPGPSSQAVSGKAERDDREEAAREVRRAARRPSLSGEDGWRRLESVEDLREWQ
jgi:hypothetical protein